MSDLWTQTLGELRTTTKRSVVSAWFEQIALVDLAEDRVALGVPDDRTRDYIEAHFLDTIRETIGRRSGRPVAVDLVVDGSGRSQGAATVEPSRIAGALRPHSRRGRSNGGAARASAHVLNLPGLSAHDAALEGDAQPAGSSCLAPRWRFDSFVVGQANEMAANASRAVADAPGALYNPLFIHGGVGLGKTHLLHAVGHAAQARDPGLRVRYVAAETFIEDCVHAMRTGDAFARARLRSLYRDDVDLLLVDDIQFLQGAEKTQEHFFHTFNALYTSGKQIALACDRYPAELEQFSARLRSRFDHGLIVEVLPPDRELRIAIVHRKAQDLRLPLAMDVVLYVADHLRNNVRELEGALNRLAAFGQQRQCAVDLAFARQVLGPLVELPSRHLTVEIIQRVVADHYGIKITDLKGNRRQKSIVEPRQLAMYLVRKHTPMSFPEIGRAFGGRDHTTAMHACQKIDFRLRSDAAIQQAAHALETALGK